MSERIERLLAMVDAQAEDEGLWFIAETAAEAYLQQELRVLHGEVEALRGEASRSEVVALTSDGVQKPMTSERSYEVSVHAPEGVDVVGLICDALDAHLPWVRMVEAGPGAYAVRPVFVRVVDPEPERCPTCGSNDPKRWGLGCRATDGRLDPWHGGTDDQ